MARPAKTLEQRLREGSFRARHHHELLSGPLVAEKRLRKLQRDYQAASSERERRAIALDFEGEARRVLSLRSAGTLPLGDCGTAACPVADFFARYLRHTKGPAAGQPFVLEAWQRDFIDEFERRDERGERVYRRGLFGVPRGNGKSPIAAGLALRELVVQRDSPDVYLAAASRDQARVVYDYAAGFVQTGPLADLLQVGRHEIRNPANGGTLRTISADGFVQHGLNPSAVVIDELHAWLTGRHRELFVALDTAIHKRPGAYWLAITTAAPDRQGLLGRLHAEMLALEVERPHRGLVIAKDEWNGALMRWYGAEDGEDFDDEKVWQAVNPASFVSRRDLRRQRHLPSMSRETFARLHLNVFVATEAERWIPGDRWQALADPGSRIEPGATVCIGFDGSRSFDTSALAWASRADDGRIDVACRVFSVREDVPHHVFHQGRIDYEDLRDSLLELAESFDVAEVAFDPRFAESSMDVVADRLPSSAVFPVEPYSRHHREALAAFERAVLEGLIRHDGDPVLAEQLAWTGVDRFDNGDPRRLRKLERARPIDASVALALAVWRVVRGDESRSVYEERGVIAV